jgi:hypothetical protein
VGAVAGIATLIATMAVFSTSAGASGTTSSSATSASSTKLDPCEINSPKCDGIGYTDSWFAGQTINLLYSHQYFCADHSLSKAPNGCEIGAATKATPPNGVVVSPIYVMLPIGFHPAGLQCPMNCIDHPLRADLTRVFGPGNANALIPDHSHIIVDREHALSAWWPVIVIGVTNQQAWNEIAHGKSLATVQRVRSRHPKWITADIPSNIYLFFQAVPGGDHFNN